MGLGDIKKLPDGEALALDLKKKGLIKSGEGSRYVGVVYNDDEEEEEEE